MSATVGSEIRRRLEDREGLLSPYAARSVLSRGRVRPETPSPMRTEFQRDRDRIVHSKAFRRLKHKTQVFIAPVDDHYVTRLTHTLEVSQIARSIARALNLNDDLVEAIALGHDLGHTPFGHVGEEVLDELYHEGFRHSEQSLRIVEKLEKDGQGLNLTWEVREGILMHSKGRGNIQGSASEQPSTLEARICRLADSVAYINHDIGDALRAGVLSEQDLPKQAVAALGTTNSARINTMVCDIIDCSWAASGLIEGGEPVVAMSPELLEIANDLREFLFRNVYEVQSARAETERAVRVVRGLYEYFAANPDMLPGEYAGADSVERRVVDYVAGMTDNYALSLARECGILSQE
jgi:dGTPase